MYSRYILSFCALAVFAPLLAQESPAEPELEPVIVTAGSDPVIAAVLADSLDHRGKVVAQTCIMTALDKEKTRREVRRYTTDGANAFQWQIIDMQINGKPASEKDMKKSLKRLEKRNKNRDADDDDRYGVFADLVANKDRIEKLSPLEGMYRYRINKLPESIAKDIPGAIANRLKPVLWIADPEGEPFVKRMEVGLGDFRMYLIAKIRKADFDLYFERRADGYVKERRVTFDLDYSVLGSNSVSSGDVVCDEGGAIVTRAAKTM
jgi:hypothetical protein